MFDPVEPLVFDLLEWIGREPRPHAEVMEAWRTSCPRLPVWEEANARGYVEHRHRPGRRGPGVAVAGRRGAPAVPFVDEMIIVLGSVVAHEGRRDEALALSEEHVARSRTEPGCIAHAAERLPRVDNDCRGLYKRSAASTRLQTNDPGEKKNMWWTRTLCTAGLIVFAGAAFAAESDEAAIRKQSIDWVKAYNAGDSAACAAEYTDDALLMAPGAPGVKGKTAIAAYLKKDIAGSKAAGATFELGPKADVGVSGNLGWESGTYKVTIKGAVVDAGKYLSVSVKKDGKWYYVRDTYNSDMAPPAPAPSK